MAHDVVVRGGTLVDGTGGPPHVLDVGIDGDRVTTIGADLPPGRQEIDATGAVVTPGFVDLHTHFDAQIGWDPLLTPSSQHGVTTVLLGNCGMTFAPVRPGAHERLASMMEAVEDIPAGAIMTGLPWSWQTYGEYLDWLDGDTRSLNVAGMVGHCALRYFVLGDRAVDGHPDAAERQQLADLVAEAVDDGAAGFSTSRYLAHLLPDGRPVPGTFADDDELLAIAESLGGRSLFQAVVNYSRFDAELDLLAGIGRATGGPVLMTAAVTDDPRSGRGMVSAIERVRRAGAALRATATPRPSGVLLSLGGLLPWRTPAWLRLAALEPTQRWSALQRRADREVLLAEARDVPPFVAAEQIFPLDVGGRVEYVSEPAGSLAARAAALGRSPAELFIEAALETEGRAMFTGRLFNRSVEALGELLASEHVVPGLGDAGAHVGQVMDAGWATFFLSHWVRDTGAFTLADGVRRLTSMPADLIGADGRGRLTAGSFADLNVIDLDRLASLVPEFVSDLPEGATRLVQGAHGYRATLVNGRPILRRDELTAERPGRVLRGRP